MLAGESMLLKAAAVAALAGLGLGGCATSGPQPSVVVGSVEAETGWRAVVTDEDSDRLARIGAAWEEGLRAARRGGFQSRIEAAGELLDPEAAIGRATLTPGSYRCRIIRLGGPVRRRAFIAYEPFFCHVGDEGELLSFTKQTGSERPAGYLWEEERDRMVFLGSIALGAEEGPPAYGENRQRDMVGVLERIGTFHWRLVLPWPRAEAALDVIELVPVLPPELQPD